MKQQRLLFIPELKYKICSKREVNNDFFDVRLWKPGNYITSSS
jgi:hypothetical protein